MYSAEIEIEKKKRSGEWATMTQSERDRWILVSKMKIGDSTYDTIQRNSDYYHLNSIDLLEKKKKKIECPLCGEMVSTANMAKHQKRSNCKRIYNMKKGYEDRIRQLEKENRELKK